jgi:hypothetical protein
MTVEISAERLASAEGVDRPVERDRDPRSAPGAASSQRQAGHGERDQRSRALTRALVVAGLVLLAGCGASSSAGPGTGGASGLRWLHFKGLHDVVDLTGPGRDGRLTATTSRRLFLLGPDGIVSPFARGRTGYRAAAGDEPYIALSPAGSARAGCSFGRDAVYALSLGSTPGVVRIDRRGRARRFAHLPGTGTPKGIAFDDVGRFGHRLIVTSTGGGAAQGNSEIFVVDCDGRVHTVTRTAPRFEGGIAVAPRSFGAYAGRLIAPDENSGHVIGIDAQGMARTIADSGLPAGGDIGVESAGFVPPGLGRTGMAYLADRSPCRGRPRGHARRGTHRVRALTATPRCVAAA